MWTLVATREMNLSPARLSLLPFMASCAQSHCHHGAVGIPASDAALTSGKGLSVGTALCPTKDAANLSQELRLAKPPSSLVPSCSPVLTKSVYLTQNAVL